MATKKSKTTNRKTTGGKSRKTAAKKSAKQQDTFFSRVRNSITSLLTGEALWVGSGLVLMLVSILMLLSFTSNFSTGKIDQSPLQSGTLTDAANWGGILGAKLSNYFMNDCFGILSYFIPIFMILVSVRLIGAYKVKLWTWFLHFSIIMIWGSVFLSLMEEVGFVPGFLSDLSFSLGGKHGLTLAGILVSMTGIYISIGIVIVLALLYLMYLTNRTIQVIRLLFNPNINKIKDDDDEESEEETAENEETEFSDVPEGGIIDEPQDDTTLEDENDVETSETIILTDKKEDDTLTGKEEEMASDLQLEIVKTSEEEKATDKTVEAEPYDPRRDFPNYKFPTIDLLKAYPENNGDVDKMEQQENKERITRVLKNFGVEIVKINATIGPTITLYEITPAPGVRINKIRNLEDDIALSLSALGIRIIAPIPGKGTIGIEVPNKQPRIVSMESIINSRKFQDTKYDLPIALGKTITNDVFMVDLAKMPHLLVAGATGQGKSVGLNAILTSLLYKKHPSELKIVMVDPKKVEFSIYAPLEKFFIAELEDQDDPVITDVTKVVQTLKSLCALMDHRYDLLKKAGARNIKEYNEKFVNRRLNPENGHAFMPYIVIIIDEFGDLIMTAGKEVELPIARIAQLARAVGMHMVIATQRPTTNIITGTIKANFPARMAFKVMSQIDSRTILDRKGANQLVGKGDMLFLSGMSGSDPVRVQCAFVDTPEVESINEFISEQHGYIEPFILPAVEMEVVEGGKMGGLDSSDIDPMLGEVARLIVTQQLGSTSLIQRKFSIGYNRAGRLMDQLERSGIVGPTRGSKPRDVLITDLNSLDEKLREMGAE